MKFINSALLLTSALGARAITAETSNTYQLRILPVDGSSIPKGFLALKDLFATTSPNALGLWLTDRVARDPYQFTFASASDSRFYILWGPERQSRLAIWGDKV